MSFIQKIEKILDRATLKSIFKRKSAPVSEQGYAYAGFHRRMFASTVDGLILMVALAPFNSLIMAYAYKDFHIDPAAVDAIIQSTQTEEQKQMAFMQLQLESGLLRSLGWLLQFQFTVLATYSFICWHFWASTPGKLLLGMRIVDAKTGARLSDIQSIIRILGYLPAGAVAMLGIFAIAWNKKRQGWHDQMARTVVIVAPGFSRKKKEVKSTLPTADPSGSQESEARE
jgi:hypothetical protein